MRFKSREQHFLATLKETLEEPSLEEEEGLQSTKQGVPSKNPSLHGDIVISRVLAGVGWWCWGAPASQLTNGESSMLVCLRGDSLGSLA